MKNPGVSNSPDRRTGRLLEFVPGAIALAIISCPATAFAASPAANAAEIFRNYPLQSALIGAGLLALLAAFGVVTIMCRNSHDRLAALQDSNEKLTGFVEATSDWVWETDTEHRYVFVSPQLTRQTGIPTDTVIGRTVFELWLHESPEVAAAHREVIARQRPFRDVVYPIRNDAGEVFWFSSNGRPYYDSRDRFVGYLGTTRNITEETKSKRQLGDNKAVTSNLFDAVPDTIIFCGPDRSIVTANPKFTDMFGYTLNEVRGRTTEFLYASRTDYEAAGQRTFDVDSERRDEPQIYPMRRKNGEIFMVDIVGSRVTNENGEEIGNVGVLRDITEREEANIALRKAKEAAELANRSKSQFLAHMSHELRTPLNAILGFSEILKLKLHGELGDERYSEYVEDIHGSGALLLSMINDILDLSRIEAGKIDPHDREIDPDLIIEESLRFLRERAARRGVSIQIAENAENVTLVADERLVKQMLLNLLSNAVKFTPPDGTIRVFATLDDEGDLRIAVADTGIGIAPEDIDRVRKPFAQAHNVWHKTGEGTGIGLYLVDSLIQAHGGSMTIASELGAGTIVTLRFPPSRVRITAEEDGVEAVS